MIRHLIVTASIVAAVYASLLWIHKDRLPEMATWSDYLDYSAETSPDWTGRSGAAFGETTPSESNAQPSDARASSQREQRLPPKSTPVQADAVPSASALTITGVTATVNLSDPTRATAQINALWQKFTDNSQLHETVSWANGSNHSYAYYHSFDSGFNQARLTIGYESEAGGDGFDVVTTKSGSYTRYEFDASGMLPDAAWEEAYPDGVILERYKISVSGDMLDGHAIVIN
ncbi:MAG: GyrI-like domain-containing protein [Pseudomonadota bacterium]